MSTRSQVHAFFLSVIAFSLLIRSIISRAGSKNTLELIQWSVSMLKLWYNNFGQPRPQGAFPWLWSRRPTSKAREKRPGDEVEFWQDSFLWQSRDSDVALVSTKGECGRHLIQGRDTGQVSYIIAQQKEMHSLGLSYTIMGYTTIFFRRLSNFKMKLTSWVGLDIGELCVFMEVNKRETSFICFWISCLG